jgi:hypothetical protein
VVDVFLLPSEMAKIPRWRPGHVDERPPPSWTGASLHRHAPMNMDSVLRSELKYLHFVIFELTSIELLWCSSNVVDTSDADVILKNLGNVL